MAPKLFASVSGLIVSIPLKKERSTPPVLSIGLPSKTFNKARDLTDGLTQINIYTLFLKSLK